MKKISARLLVNSVFIGIQAVALIFFIVCFYIYSGNFYKFIRIAGFITALKIISSHKNPSFKIIWTVFLLEFPLTGIIIYIFSCIERFSVKDYDKYHYSNTTDDSKVSAMLMNENQRAYSIYKYINNVSGSNVYSNTITQLFPCGELFISDYVSELKKAEKFIFIEYFIINKGAVWNEVLEILKEKSLNGVSVLIIYDGLGTVNYFPENYFEKLSEYGIKSVAVNQFYPALNTLFQCRDHRKITVIDNKTAYTGGINLSDEYINLYQPYGYWKDYALKFQGDAVSEFSEMFLNSWNFFSTSQPYYPANSLFLCNDYKNDGFVIPFGDIPYKKNPAGKSAYMLMIQSAEKYVYITTPYLILDGEMISLLRMKAMSGVDVRIITPHIPDKKYVFAVTRSNYQKLIDAGVRIFEYEKGFVHAKAVISDDDYAISGTVNFDFRSFHMLFENSVFMYKSKAVYQIKSDCMKMMQESIEITDDFFRTLSLPQKFIYSMLNFFSSLM